MRNLPKSLFAGYVKSAELIAPLAGAITDGGIPGQVATEVMNYVFDPAIQFIDLDDPLWLSGSSALIGFGVIAEDNVSAIEAMFAEYYGGLWTYFGAVNDGGGKWILVFERDGEQKSVTVKTNDPATSAAEILAGGSL